MSIAIEDLNLVYFNFQAQNFKFKNHFLFTFVDGIHLETFGDFELSELLYSDNRFLY